MRSRLVLCLLACGALGLGALNLSACSDDDFGHEQPGEDMAAPGQDAGTDAATLQDATPVHDAAVTPDATVNDATVSSDAASNEDAAVTGDAATPDGAATGDAG